MQHPLLLRLFTISAFLVGLGLFTSQSEASPIRQTLNRPSSSIRFGVQSQSPALTMNGSFKTFRGDLLLDPSHFENSLFDLSLELDSAQLPADQLLQALFIQTTLSRFRDRSGSFVSTSIEPLSKSRFIVTGECTWNSQTRSTKVPIEVIHLSPSRSEIRFLLDGAVRPQDVKPEVSKIAPGIAGTKGWAKANLIFVSK